MKESSTNGTLRYIDLELIPDPNRKAAFMQYSKHVQFFLGVTSFLIFSNDVCLAGDRFFLPVLSRKVQTAGLGGPHTSKSAHCAISKDRVQIIIGAESGGSYKDVQYTSEIRSFKEVLVLIAESRNGEIKSLPAPMGGNSYSYIAAATTLGSRSVILKSRSPRERLMNDSDAADALIGFMDLNCDE